MGKFHSVTHRHIAHAITPRRDRSGVFYRLKLVCWISKASWEIVVVVMDGFVLRRPRTEEAQRAGSFFNDDTRRTVPLWKRQTVTLNIFLIIGSIWKLCWLVLRLVCPRLLHALALTVVFEVAYLICCLCVVTEMLCSEYCALLFWRVEFALACKLVIACCIQSCIG